MAQDPYKELGVARGASDDEVQKAYRKLAKQFHPDHNPGKPEAEERFKRINAAFDLLKDPVRRKRFDAGEIDVDGRDTFRGAGFGRSPGGGGFSSQGFEGAGPGAGARFEGIDLDEIFDMFGGGGGGRGRTSRTETTRGHDVRISLEIDLLDTIKGNTRRVVLSDGRALDITIPKGAHDGQTLRLKGQGQSSPIGGARGDALVEIKVRPHPVFKTDGADLGMELWVSVPDAILGARLDVQTPDGPVTLTLPPASQAGTTLRLKGRGGIDPRSLSRGDLLVRVLIALPDEPGTDLIQFAEQWRRTSPYVPDPNSPKRKPRT